MSDGTVALTLLLVIVVIAAVCVYLDSVADRRQDDETK
jgi:hypothetical protein